MLSVTIVTGNGLAEEYSLLIDTLFVSDLALMP